MSRQTRCVSVLCLTAAFMCGALSYAQAGRNAPVLVSRGVDENQLITRPGNIHPAVASATDLGKMADDRLLEHLRLQLKRPAGQQAELQHYIDSLNDPNSRNFHSFGNAAQFVQRFGLAQQDIDAVKDWLTSHGFKVNSLSPSMAIDFSGTAGQVAEAFHTEIHYIEVNGKRHFANVSNPKIPAALAEVVLGPVALHDFKPKKLTTKVKPPVTEYTVSAGNQIVTPLDLQTIYNFNSLYSYLGISGQGQTVVVLERTDLYSTGDFQTFRNVLGLSATFPQGNLITVHPQPMGKGTTENGIPIAPETCSDPGVVVGDDGEAAVDAEWASASAPNATIELASCADTETNFGAFIALENLLACANPPAIMSLSYGSPESGNGANGNAYINALYQLAVFEGVSVFVSTGDADGDVTDSNQPYATNGINVNALASTPNNVAVGGTDYGDTFLGENSTYWNATNGPSYNSALSYVPEIPWNDSCASQLIATALGYQTTYGAGGFCNSALGEVSFLTTAGGSGGPSGCAYGQPAIPGVVSGTCTGYTKPAFQGLVYGNPADRVRDLPDVSMFAANGVWGHYFVLCYSDPLGGGVPCTGAPSNWSGAGGTSFGAPIWAGIQALINQNTESRQGNPNFAYYQLGGTEYGASGSSTCNSTLGNGTSSNCIFYDVTLGDNDANCQKLDGVSYGCYYPSTQPGANGVLSRSKTAYEPAFVTTVGYDLATGIGTPNVYNLVSNFPGSRICVK